MVEVLAITHPPTADEDTRIGLTIYQLRNAAGLKRPAFAVACKIKISRLIGIEEGSRKIRPSELYRVAVELEVRMEVLMGKPSINFVFDWLEGLKNTSA